MESGVFLAGEALARRLPPGLLCPPDAAALAAQDWALLALTRRGCAALARSGTVCRCGTLLLPGDLGRQALSTVRADRAVTFGLDSRDSLTYSSLSTQRMACLQRTLLRPGGGLITPREAALAEAELCDEDALLLWGLRLLL